MSRVTAIISALVICIIVCPSWAVNHYRDNAITYKAQRQKCQRELKLANAAITDMQMRQRDVAALDAKYTKELADAKAENDALRDDVAAGRRRLHISSSSVSVKPPPPPAWIMQPSPRLADTAERDYFTFRERLITVCVRPLEGTQKYINELVQIELPISMGNSCNGCEHCHTRFQRSINACVLNKTGAIHLMFAVSVLTTFSAPPQILLHRQFSAQFQNEEMMGDGFPLVLLLPVCLNSKRLLSTSCNKQGQLGSL